MKNLGFVKRVLGEDIIRKKIKGRLVVLEELY